MRNSNELLRDERGPTAIEYCLPLALAMVMPGVLNSLGLTLWPCSRRSPQRWAADAALYRVNFWPASAFFASSSATAKPRRSRPSTILGNPSLSAQNIGPPR